MLITFEGIDGSGKSTQARLLVERLEAAGRSPLLVREPGGTPLGEQVRALLLDPAFAIVPVAELCLFSAARAQLVAARIRPALEAGGLVVCDRFYDSTTAYQGAGRELYDLAWLQDFNRRVTGGLGPDRTYLVELDVAAAQARRTGQAADRMEQADAAFYRRVAAAYAALAEAAPDRFHRLDGALPPEVLHEQVWADFQARAAARGTLR